MQLALCPQPLYRLPLDQALTEMTRLGTRAMELPLDAGNPWIDVERLAAGDCDGLLDSLRQHRIELSAVSVHQEGQLLFGPHHQDTDSICPGSAADKIAFAQARILRAARVAKYLGVEVVVGFVGCEDYTRFFPWPAADGWQRMLSTFRERLLPLLDELHGLGVHFAQEPHPKQLVYNTETALESLTTLDDHPAWAFNLDPANLLLAGVDPVVFVAELGARVRHVHAKDGELVAHHAGRSGLLAHGPWDRKDRGFRFRIPGWGDVPWRRLISELILAGYPGVLAVEHEDPLFGPVDGLCKAVDFLAPLLPEGEREERWW